MQFLRCLYICSNYTILYRLQSGNCIVTTNGNVFLNNKFQNNITYNFFQMARQLSIMSASCMVSVYTEFSK